jgi:hypothetical protein
MSHWRLQKPPSVVQGTGFKCWAAALESLLAVIPGRPKLTQGQLLEWAKLWCGDFGRDLPPGAINAEIFKKMAVDELLGLRLSWEEIPLGTGLADDTLYGMLFEFGYLFVSYTVENSNVDRRGGIRHCIVVWAANDTGGIAVMNPSTGAYENKVTEDIGGPILIAFRPPAPPGAF